MSPLPAARLAPGEASRASDGDVPASAPAAPDLGAQPGGDRRPRRKASVARDACRLGENYLPPVAEAAAFAASGTTQMALQRQLLGQASNLAALAGSSCPRLGRASPTFLRSSSCTQLFLNQLVVHASSAHQFLVPSLLRNRPLVQHENFFCPPDRTEPVRDDHRLPDIARNKHASPEMELYRTACHSYG